MQRQATRPPTDHLAESTGRESKPFIYGRSECLAVGTITRLSSNDQVCDSKR